MSRSRKNWWPMFFVCAALVVAAMTWISLSFLQMERAQQDVRAQQQFQELQRLALWRLDSYFYPLLTRESARPYFEYSPYHSEGGPPGTEAGTVLSPSPLLSAPAETVPLYFQIDAEDQLTSPQVPIGGFRELAEGTCHPGDTIEQSVQRLNRVRAAIHLPTVRQRVAAAEQAESEILGDPSRSSLPSVLIKRDLPDPQMEWNARAKNAFETKNQAKASLERLTGGSQVTAAQAIFQVLGDQGLSEPHYGSLVPIWLGDEQRELSLIRRVVVDESEILQGMLLDWPRIRNQLQREIEDLIPGATLEPVLAANRFEDPTALTLASMPLVLRAEAPGVSHPAVTPARATLALAWIAVAGALIAVGVTLRSSIDFGARRARFASAVSHELRTPLTTFRMYSEMLADDMVKDPERRKLYLETLKGEANRLSVLVQNVLSYARIEEGKTPPREEVSAQEILDRVLPELDRRARESGMNLDCKSPAIDSSWLSVDRGAVEQILFNLVDNSCKYAGSDAGTVTLQAEPNSSQIEFHVLDQGPGIPVEARTKIFEPFERADHEGDPSPGIGLGLAFARTMARHLGGDLTASHPAEGGACFTLRLPSKREPVS